MRMHEKLTYHVYNFLQLLVEQSEEETRVG